MPCRARYDSLSKLEEFRVNSGANGHGLSGTLSGGLGVLANIKTLDFTNTALSGTLPLEISRLSQLSMLKISQSPHFSGTMPAQLAQLAQLNSLRFDDISVSGTLPPEDPTTLPPPPPPTTHPHTHPPPHPPPHHTHTHTRSGRVCNFVIE